MNTQINPLTKLDYPDPDVIRVDDTYYMVSTTMYFMPGCEILKSHDLVNWEHLTYVFDRLDSTPAQALSGKENIYGQGMWAASLRLHNGIFYICFVANDTHKTYIYSSPSITGPWEKYTLEGFYHDNSILFDDDGKVYIIYGNRHIYIKELNLTGDRLSDVDPSNPEKLIISDSDDAYLGYEGAHFYKIGGQYYIFLIHIPKSTGKRTESCFVSDSPFGPYVGKDVMDDDRNFRNSGVAQGGIVQTPNGNWYGILFQDSGAVGRIPVLMPVTFVDDFPVFGTDGKIPDEFEIEDLRPGYKYTPLVSSDDFTTDYSQSISSSFGFNPCWQFNHEPDLSLIKRDTTKGTVTITTDKICSNLVQAKNVLTQRTLFPKCSCDVTIDASALNDGDYVGLCVLESCYGFIAITREASEYYLVMGKREITTGGLFGERHDDEPFDEVERIKIDSPVVRLFSSVRFDTDEADFFYSADSEDSDDIFDFISDLGIDLDDFDEGDEEDFDQDDSADYEESIDLKPLGTTHKLVYKLDHFTGARFGLFIYSTKSTGGSATFSGFNYDVD